MLQKLKRKQKKCQWSKSANPSSISIDNLKQDEDVLDTWFSSWLWPIEVFKGITQPGNKDINYYYPTSVLGYRAGYYFFLGGTNDNGRNGIHE